jgi:hypothetical protein
MALHWRPVGPEPASTYWQRRAVVAVLALLPFVLLFSLLGGGDEAPDTLAEQAPTPTATPEPSATPTPTTSPTPAPVRGCAPQALEIDAVAGENSYPVSATPRLTLSVTNTGPQPCSVDLGSAAVELLVFSGSDRIWSSDDCAKGPAAAKRVTLAPGKAEAQSVTWNGRRSRPGCAGAKEQAQPGTYRVRGRVGQQTVQGDSFVLRG